MSIQCGLILILELSEPIRVSHGAYHSVYEMNWLIRTMGELKIIAVSHTKLSVYLISRKTNEFHQVEFLLILNELLRSFSVFMVEYREA